MWRKNSLRNSPLMGQSNSLTKILTTSSNWSLFRSVPVWLTNQNTALTTELYWDWLSHALARFWMETKYLASEHIWSLSYQQFYQILTSYAGLTYHSIAIFYQKEFHKAVKLWQQDRTLSQDMIDISRLNRFITTTTWGVCSLESIKNLNFRLGIQPKVL